MPATFSHVYMYKPCVYIILTLIYRHDRTCREKTGLSCMCITAQRSRTRSRSLAWIERSLYSFRARERHSIYGLIRRKIYLPNQKKTRDSCRLSDTTDAIVFSEIFLYFVQNTVHLSLEVSSLKISFDIFHIIHWENDNFHARKFLLILIRFSFI